MAVIDGRLRSVGKADERSASILSPAGRHRGEPNEWVRALSLERDVEIQAVDINPDHAGGGIPVDAQDPAARPVD